MMPGADLLLEEDREYLERRGWDFEVHKVDTPGNMYELQIMVHNYPLPAKYSPRVVDMLVRQLPGYPETAMDMFWTRPDVVIAETNSPPQATDMHENYSEMNWQSWSRHGAWRAGIDCLETFFAAIDTELKK